MRKSGFVIVTAALSLVTLGAGDAAVAQPSELCVPALTSPREGAVMPQMRQPDGRFETVWPFSWRACPRADAYHLFVIGPNARNPAVDVSNLERPSYTDRSTHYGIETLEGWTWRVRARYGETWGDWSAPRSFNVAPKASAPQARPCSIDGRVRGHSPAYRTSVELRRASDNRRVDTAEVNSRGEYRFANVPAGDYSLVPRAVFPQNDRLTFWFDPMTAAAPCRPNATVHKNFQIRSDG